MTAGKAGDRLYRWMLRSYPTAFRERFGEELLQVCRAAAADGSRSRLRLSISLLTGGMRERRLNLPVSGLLCWLTALSLAVMIALMDQQATEPQPAALMLILAALALTLWRPRGSWGRAFLLGAGIPVLGWVSVWLRPRAPGLPEPNAFAGAIALIPALLGAAGGRMLRWLMAQAGEDHCAVTRGNPGFDDGEVRLAAGGPVQCMGPLHR